MKKYKDLIIFLIICLAIIFVRFAVIRTITAKALYYTVNDDGKTCTITGCKNEDIKRLYVPRKINGYKVTKIASHSFCELHQLKSVIIPGSVKYFGSMNFEFDLSLDINNVMLPQSLYYYDGNEKYVIFYDEEKKGYHVGLLKKSKSDIIVVPEKIKGEPVTGLLDDAFADCNKAQKISIPPSVEYYGERVFDSCRKLTSVSLNSEMKEVKTAMFKGCYSLLEVGIPDGVETIGDDAFLFCDSLKTISFPEGVKVIGDRAIGSCESLESVYFPRSVEFIAKTRLYGNLDNCPSLTAIYVYKDTYAEKWCEENGFAELIKYVE